MSSLLYAGKIETESEKRATREYFDNFTDDQLDEVTEEVRTALDEPGADLDKLEIQIRQIGEVKRQRKIEKRSTAVNSIINNPAKGKSPFEYFGGVEKRSDKPMDNINEQQDIEIRAFQKYVTGQYAMMDDVEKRALAVAGAAAVMPIKVQNTLITSEKYSDLLHRATVINEGGAAKVYIPVASNTAASWKTENDDTGLEASPTLTKLELGGFELMRLMQVSAAASSMSIGNFQDLMLELLASEVIETLEKSFISGVGTTMPKGLDELTWTPDTNQILTASDVTPIAASDIAEAISLLPQKYARNAIILMNSDMAYKVSQFLGTAEYAYSMADGATKFLGKPIVISEHMADDTVYIVDPKQLYVRFADPIQVEIDRSAGFTSASIYLRALTVVDAVWNPAACVAVGLGAGGE